MVNKVKVNGTKSHRSDFGSIMEQGNQSQGIKGQNVKAEGQRQSKKGSTGTLKVKSIKTKSKSAQKGASIIDLLYFPTIFLLVDFQYAKFVRDFLLGFNQFGPSGEGPFSYAQDFLTFQSRQTRPHAARSRTKQKLPSAVRQQPHRRCCACQTLETRL